MKYKLPMIIVIVMLTISCNWVVFNQSQEKVNVTTNNQSESPQNVVQTENVKPSSTPLPLPSNTKLSDNLPTTITLEVKGIDIGASYQTVLSQLGKPLSSKKGGIVPCSDYSTLLTLRYSGLVIELYSDDDTQNFYVFTMEVTSPKWSVSGINVGATLKDVQEKFGQTKKPRKESGLENLPYYITDGYANFYFRNNKLVKVNWELNLC